MADHQKYQYQANTILHVIMIFILQKSIMSNSHNFSNTTTEISFIVKFSFTPFKGLKLKQQNENFYQ